jgi:hypothetical protein
VKQPEPCTNPLADGATNVHSAAGQTWSRHRGQSWSPRSQPEDLCPLPLGPVLLA